MNQWGLSPLIHRMLVVYILFSLSYPHDMHRSIVDVSPSIDIILYVSKVNIIYVYMYNNNNHDGLHHDHDTLVHVGFVIACMAIIAAVALLLVQTFDGKPLSYQNNILGKTVPSEGELIVHL